MAMGVVIIKGATDNSFTRILPQRGRCNFFHICIKVMAVFLLQDLVPVTPSSSFLLFFSLTATKLYASSHIL